MDKEKLIKAGIWFAGFSTSIILAALTLYIGFNNRRYGDNTILVIGLALLPLVFYCAYKGLKLIIEAIFQ